MLEVYVSNITSCFSCAVSRRPDVGQVEFSPLVQAGDLARELHAGLCDVFFFADLVGWYNDFGGSSRKHPEAGL